MNTNESAARICPYLIRGTDCFSSLVHFPGAPQTCPALSTESESARAKIIYNCSMRKVLDRKVESAIYGNQPAVVMLQLSSLTSSRSNVESALADQANLTAVP